MWNIKGKRILSSDGKLALFKKLLKTSVNVFTRKRRIFPKTNVVTEQKNKKKNLLIKLIYVSETFYFFEF